MTTYRLNPTPEQAAEIAQGATKLNKTLKVAGRNAHDGKISEYIELVPDGDSRAKAVAAVVGAAVLASGMTTWWVRRRTRRQLAELEQHLVALVAERDRLAAELEEGRAVGLDRRRLDEAEAKIVDLGTRRAELQSRLGVA